MSGETQVERPEPREDGSYPRPMWPGRWWVVGGDTEFQSGYEVVETRSGLCDADPPRLKMENHTCDGDHWYPIPPIPGLDGAAPSEEPEPTPAVPPPYGSDEHFWREAYDRHRASLDEVNAPSGGPNHRGLPSSNLDGRIRALAAQRDAAQAEVDRLTKERDAIAVERDHFQSGYIHRNDEVNKLREDAALAVRERDEARRRLAGLERRELEKTDATSLRSVDALLASRGFPSEDSVYLRVKKVLDLERDGRLQWDKARLELAEVECEKKELATLLEAREAELARQSAPRPLPAGHDWKMVRRRFNEALTNEWHWIQATGKAGLALLDWAESQPGAATEAEPAVTDESDAPDLEAGFAKFTADMRAEAERRGIDYDDLLEKAGKHFEGDAHDEAEPSLAATVAKLEARVAALEAREATLLKQEEIRCAHSTWRSGVGNSKWMA